LNTILGLT
jgi:hypothetical protein